MHGPLNVKFVIKLVLKSAFLILCLDRLVFLCPRLLNNISWNDVISGTVLVYNISSLEYNFCLFNFRILQRDIGSYRDQFAICLYFSDFTLKCNGHVLGKSRDNVWRKSSGWNGIIPCRQTDALKTLAAFNFFLVKLLANEISVFCIIVFCTISEKR